MHFSLLTAVVSPWQNAYCHGITMTKTLTARVSPWPSMVWPCKLLAALDTHVWKSRSCMPAALFLPASSLCTASSKQLPQAHVPQLWWMSAAINYRSEKIDTNMLCVCLWCMKCYIIHTIVYVSSASVYIVIQRYRSYKQNICFVFIFDV